MKDAGDRNTSRAVLRGQSLVALSLLLVVLAGVGAFWVRRVWLSGSLNGPEATRAVAIGFVLLVASTVCLAFTTVAFFTVGVIRWALADTSFGYLRDVAELAGRLDEQLRVISSRLMISEAAKRITCREQDRAALRVAIEEDIKKGDFNAALVLVSEMAQTYGYTAEAEEFRERISSARAVNLASRVAEAMAGFEQLLARYDWDKAHEEAGKIQRLFPDVPAVRDLPRRVKDAWDMRKHDLERQFLQAASHDDVETAMDLIKEMDRYLTEREAAPFLETARGVIGKKRQNLGVQFKLSVQDHEWTRAVAVGEQIIREFPNTKMSDEVRERIDILRERAAGQRAAERAQSPV